MRFSDLSPSLAGWLADAADTSAVTEALVAADPALGERLVHAAAKRLRLADRTGVCRGSYVLTLRAIDGVTTEQVPVSATVRPPEHGHVGVSGGDAFGTAGWAVHLDRLGIDLATLPDELDLISYASLADPTRAASVLTEVLRTGTRASDGIVIRSAHPSVMRYKRGSRCTFRYEVEVEGPGSTSFPSTMIAKTYSRDKGAVADRSMRALWDSSLRHSSTVRIAEPLGYDDERRILLQGPVPEQRTLRQALMTWFTGTDPAGWDGLIEMVHRAGVGLGEMHAAGVTVGEDVGISDELDEVRERVARVAAVFSNEGPMLQQALAIVDDMASRSGPEPAVGSHRSFRPAQVLLSGPTMSFIDFDGFCQTEPAMDVAMFRSMVRSIALNKGHDETASLVTMSDESRHDRLADGERLCQAFLAGYRSVASVSDERLLLWETVQVAGIVVASWTKLKLSRLPNALYLLDDQLARCGISPDLR